MIIIGPGFAFLVLAFFAGWWCTRAWEQADIRAQRRGDAREDRDLMIRAARARRHRLVSEQARDPIESVRAINTDREVK